MPQGVPFRDAHAMSGRLVLAAIDRECALEELPLECYRAECPAVEEDIYALITPEACVSRRKTEGGPAPEAMAREIARYRALLGMD